jgi:beta-mannosidase
MLNNRTLFWFVFFLTTVICSGGVVAQRILLNDSWSLSSGARNMQLPVTVPGTVYGDLLKHGLVADVMKGEHEADIQWIANGTWIYYRELEVTDTMLLHAHAELVFEGLDTYAKVYVNDSLVITATNMFRSWRSDVRPLMKKGINSIRVELLPATALAEQAAANFHYKLPQTDTSATTISSLVRKAPYHFGWDWAPRIPDRGIWRPVYLELWSKMQIRDFTIHTVSLKNEAAQLEARVRISSDTIFKKATVTIDQNSFPCELISGTHLYVFRFTVSKPELWWPNGSGKQVLNIFQLQVKAGNSVLGTATTRTGIRTVELVRETDTIGTAFYFKVNGQPLFMMGANYVPPFQWDTTAAREKFIAAAKEVGMNMIRVWGGGVYEDDAFYNLCDENGILVWQDLMFACAMVPGDSLFLENVKEEVRQQATRLSGHPSLALWCGNNESDVAWKNWGWQKQYNYSPADSAAIYEAYIRLFQNAVPQVLSESDPFTSYVHTSPLSNWGKKENFNHHNMHYWGVWHGEEAIDSFKVNVPRFMTEYGMQSFPSFHTLSVSAGSDTMQLSNSFIASKQKSYKGNRLLYQYIADGYGEPRSVEALCYLSQLMQADAMDIAIRSHRKAAGHCMGTLYWQLNDVWPGASWSTLEHNGTWKAAHYKLSELYAPHLLIPVQQDDSLHVYYVSTDNLPIRGANIDVNVMSLSGKPLGAHTVLDIESGKDAVEVFVFKLAELAPDSTDAVVLLHLISNGKTLASALHYFVKPNQLKLSKPEIKKSIVFKNGITEITLETNILAKGVYLQYKNTDGRFSDNYFDLLPGEQKTVMFEGQLGLDELVIQTYFDFR